MVHVLNGVSFLDHKVVVLTLEKSFVPLLPGIFYFLSPLCVQLCVNMLGRSFLFGMLVCSSLFLDISKFHSGKAHDIFRLLNKKKFSFLQLRWVWDTDLGRFRGIVCPFLVWKHTSMWDVLVRERRQEIKKHKNDFTYYPSPITFSKLLLWWHWSKNIYALEMRQKLMSTDQHRKHAAWSS